LFEFVCSFSEWVLRLLAFFVYVLGGASIPFFCIDIWVADYSYFFRFLFLFDFPRFRNHLLVLPFGLVLFGDSLLWLPVEYDVALEFLIQPQFVLLMWVSFF